MFTVPQRYGWTERRADRQTDGRLTIEVPRFAQRASRGKNVYITSGLFQIKRQGAGCSKEQ